MVSMQRVEEQLIKVGCNFKLWGRSEVRELANVLMPEEQVAQAVNGSYEGGFALLAVTNYRVLLIDRKPMLLTIEDIRYDMLAEVDYFNRMFGSTIRLMTPMRNLEFHSWSVTRLRKCLNYIQQRVMELRQHGFMANQLLQTQVNGMPQGPVANAAQFDPRQWVTASAPAGAPGAVSSGQGGAGNGIGYVAPGYPSPSPYTKVPLMLKRRRFPSFY